MARYILVIHTDEAAWAAKTPQEKRAVYEGQQGFVDRLTELGGSIRGGAELHPSSTARVVRHGAGRATEGPFAETAEQIGGFLDVECDDLDDLLDAVSLLPAVGESVEVRRVFTDEEREAEVS